MPENPTASERVQLQERVKELQCLYRVAELSQKRDTSSQDYLSALPDLLPPGWFYPELAAARIEYRGQHFQTANFQETPWKLAAPLNINDRAAGHLEVIYLQEMPTLNEGPFLAEERELLDALAAHITKTLQNKELEERLRRTQRLEALGFLAGGVAQDFQCFLRVINTVSEQALRKVDRRHPVSNDLQEILSVVERACRLANRLVGFAGSREPEPTAMSINEPLTNCRAMLGRLLSEKVELRLDLDTDLRPVELDPTQLDQIIANLAVNAREAMPEGGTFEVMTRNLSGDRVLLACHDTGCGMSKETQSRLFEPFYSTKGVGSGLGLATVEEIVRQVGGEISVQSAIGHGTRFDVVFPAATRPPQGEAAPEEPALARGRTILLVDSDPAQRYLCERTLGTMGYTVLTAETAEDAETIAGQEETAIDLLLCELTLLDTSGRALPDRMRQERPDLLVLLMAGYRLEVLAESAEGYAFIQKPFNRETLREKLRELLGPAEEASPKQS